MQTIEPNLTSLLWFAALATVAMLALLIVAGTFPFRPPPDATRSDATPLLVAGNAVLLAALLVGTGIYGYAELRLTTLIIVAGLAVLFAPALFEIWPSFLRDGPAALGVLVGVQLLALVALARVAGFGWSNLS